MSQSDPEPVQKYDLNDIASCYVGDLGIKHKRPYVILPTLILHFKTQSESSAAARAFRRRSHDSPYSPKAAQTALFFRPPVDGPDELNKWAKEIQNRITPNATNSSTDLYRPSTLDAPANAFLVNGEPSTTLLSPSVRSQSSDVSSEKRSIKSSSSDGGFSTSADSPSLSGMKASPIDSSFPGLNLPKPRTPKQMVSPPPRRETILDRYFATTPNIPETSMPGASSIARFEALVSSDPSIRKAVTQPTSPLYSDTPKRIPSPTQRALDFISGVLQESDEEEEEEEPLSRPSLPTSPQVGSPTAQLGTSFTSVNGTLARERKDSISSLSSISAQTSALSISESSYRTPTPLNIPRHSTRHPSGGFVRSAPPTQQSFSFEK